MQVMLLLQLQVVSWCLTLTQRGLLLVSRCDGSAKGFQAVSV
jgi:hypothetical protein